MKELFNILSNVSNFLNEKRFIYQDVPKPEPKPEDIKTPLEALRAGKPIDALDFSDEKGLVVEGKKKGAELAKRGKLETIDEIVGRAKKPGEKPVDLGADIEEGLAKARKDEALARMDPKDREFIDDYFKALEEGEKGEKKPSMVAREAGEAERARAKQTEAFARMPKKDQKYVRDYFKSVFKRNIGK